MLERLIIKDAKSETRKPNLLLELQTLKEKNPRFTLGSISGIEEQSKNYINERDYLECRGVYKKGTSVFLKDLIWDYSADFVGIQETMNKNYFEKFFIELDLQRIFCGIGLLLEGNLAGC